MNEGIVEQKIKNEIQTSVNFLRMKNFLSVNSWISYYLSILSV